jgi:hypothetical protein
MNSCMSCCWSAVLRQTLVDCVALLWRSGSRKRALYLKTLKQNNAATCIQRFYRGVCAVSACSCRTPRLNLCQMHVDVTDAAALLCSHNAWCQQRASIRSRSDSVDGVSSLPLPNVTSCSSMPRCCSGERAGRSGRIKPPTQPSTCNAKRWRRSGRRRWCSWYVPPRRPRHARISTPPCSVPHDCMAATGLTHRCCRVLLRACAEPAGVRVPALSLRSAHRR